MADKRLRTIKEFIFIFILSFKTQISTQSTSDIKGFALNSHPHWQFRFDPLPSILASSLAVIRNSGCFERILAIKHPLLWMGRTT